MKNKVVCVSVPPSYQDPKDQYVEKLHRALKRHLTKPFEFECRRDNPYEGFFNKLLLFPPKERIVFLDLDTIIVDNVDFLFEYDGNFCILKDFYHINGYGSAIMNIAPGFGRDILAQFKRYGDRLDPIAGDQDWIRLCVDNADFWQTLYPNKIVSFIKHDCEKGLPKDAAIVCYHGLPKPTDMAHLPWMKEHWC